MGFKVIDDSNLSDLWQRSKDMTDNRIKNSDLAYNVKEISDISINNIPTIHKVTSIDLYGGGMVEALNDGSSIAISIGDYIYAENDISKTFNFGYEVTKTLKAGYYRVKSVYSNGHAVICVTNSSTVPDSTYGIVNITDLEKTILLERIDVNNKVDKVTGKGLSTNDYTNEDKEKVNDIPTKTSDLENDSDFVSDENYVHTDNNYTSTEKNKLSGIEAGAQVNFDFDNTTSQMLRGTNSNKTTATGLWSDSAWYTNGDVISVSDAPNPDIKYGYSLARGNSIRQKDIAPSDDNYTDYTVSFYAKGTGILNIEFMYEEGTAFNPYYMTFSTPFNIESSKWKRYTFTIKKEDSRVNANSTHLGLGIVVNNSTEETTLQICGVKMERGDVATPWCLSQYEIDNANVDLGEIESDIEDLETNQTQILSDIEDLESSLSLTTTTTGNPISISDSAHVNAEELTVELEPIQDLHGYDKPWVGGAGKNKLPLVLSDIKTANTSGTWSGNTYTLNGVTFEVLTDSADNVEGIKVNGTASAWTTLNLNAYPFEVGNYILSNSEGVPSGQYVTITDVGALSNGASTMNVSISASATHNVYIGVDSGTQANIIYQPMIRLATETDPTYEPYSNICPISGYDETSVVRSGKNLFDKDHVETGYINSDGTVNSSASGWKSSEYIKVAPQSQMCISGISNSYSSSIGGAFFSDDKSFLQSFTTASVIENPLIIVPYNAKFIRFSMTNNDVETAQIELGSTATTFEPYTADTYTLQFGDTVYGAEVDFVSGVATVKYGYEKFDGSDDEDWSISLNRFTIEISSPCKATTDSIASISNLYETKTGGNVYANRETDGYTGIAVFGDGLFLVDNLNFDVSSKQLSDWKTYLSTNPLQVCYELAAPYTIQLTPQQIKMLKGNNVLTADGDMDLTYQVDSVVGDVKEWAENEFLPKNSATAQHNYSTQEQVVGTWIDGSTLYEKTYYIQNPVSEGNYPLDIPNIDTVVKIEGTWRRYSEEQGYDWWYPVNAVNEGGASGTTYSVIIRPRLVSTNDLYVFVGSAYTQDCKLIICTIQYTKTED